jgi:protein-S-isoprenylcysteine O-methyltransferase Ste14
MSFQEKNVTVSLVTFLLILGFFLISVFLMVQDENFTSANVFRLWGIVIVLAIAATILGTILTHIVSAIIEAIRTGEEDPKIEDFEDERDKLVDLKGTKVAFIVSSIGVLLAMLTFVFGQPPLGMFTLIILAGILAQIAGDVSRLVLYRRGF